MTDTQPNFSEPVVIADPILSQVPIKKPGISILMIALIVGVLLLLTGIVGYFIGMQQVKVVNVVPNAPSGGEFSYQNDFGIESTPVVKVPEKQPLVVGYTSEGGMLVLAYNQTPEPIEPFGAIAENYPELESASFYKHGTVVSNTFGIDQSFGDITNWNIVSAIIPRKVDGSVNSEFEKDVPQYSSIFGLTSNDYQEFILLHSKGHRDRPLTDKKYLFYDLSKNFGFAFFEYDFNYVTTTYLNILRGTGQTGGGSTELLSDRGNRYAIQYQAALFEPQYQSLTAVDFMYGRPIYTALDQSNVFKSYTKYVMQAENGMSYMLYRKN